MKKYNHIIKILFCVVLLFGGKTTMAQDNTEAVESVATTTSELKTIVGQIRNVATNAPILGARVQSKDFKYSAMTDEKGNFSIKIPQEITLLSVSAHGFSNIEYPIQNKSSLDITLFSELPENRNKTAITLDEDIQYLTGSSIRSYRRSGMPGIGSSMYIRGYNSLNAGSQPLIIVDGVVFDNQYDRYSIHEGFILNPLSNISVDDIESVQVLKDASSVFASKEGNGAIVIKTKRAKDPVTKIAFTSMMGYNKRPKTTPMLNSDQFRIYVSDILKGILSDPAQISSLPFLNDDPKYYDYLRYHNSNDWTKDVLRNSITQSYNINVSGGDDVALYNLSIGYANAGSVIKKTDFSRFNARFNSDITLSTKFGLSFDLSYSQTDSELRDDGFNEEQGELITSPLALSKIKAPFLIPYEHANNGNVTNKLSDADFLNIANPMSILNTGEGDNSQTYLSLILKPYFKFNDNFKLDGTFSYTLNSMFEKYYRPVQGVAPVYQSGVMLKNLVQAQNSKQNSLSSGLFAHWKNEFDIHHLNFIGGFHFISDSYDEEYGSGYNTSGDLDKNLSSSLTLRRALGVEDNKKTMSWYAKPSYSLLDKYEASVSLSAVTSSRFGKDADLAFKLGGVNWAFYPSINASWLISSENFMKELPFVDKMKLRATYGFAGNDNIPQEALLTYFSSIHYLGTYTGKGITNIGNSYIKPETVEKRNLGLDLGFLNNRITLSIDVFHQITSDLLTLKKMDYIGGKDYYWTNSGKLENKGYEISIDAKVVAIKDFRWDLGLSVAHYKNNILKLPDGNYTTNIYGGEILTSIGNPAGLFYGYKTKGVFSTTKDAVESGLKMLDYTGVGYTAFGAGDIIFEDSDNNYIIDEKDKTTIGNPNPDFTGMFNTTFYYKRLSLSALFTFSYGNDIYNYMRSQLESGSNLYNQTTALQNRWVNEGQTTSIPKINYGDPMGNSRFSDRWIEDGSYLRLKTLSVSYDIPINALFLSGITVWASANNLWTYTKYLGNDPEFSINNSILYQGIDAGVTPQSKSYFIGLKLNL